MMNKQCSLALCFALALPLSLDAQERMRVTVTENFRQEGSTDGRLLARINPGTVVTAGGTRDGWVQVTLEGWVIERSVRASPNDEYDLAVRQSGGENLRDAPNGRVLARMLEGFLLDEVARREGWVQVRRTGWMWGRSLAREAAATASRPAPPANGDATPTPAPAAGALDQVMVGSGARIHARPDGDTLATIHRPTSGRVLARADGWARVQTEAWVRESDLSADEDSVLVGVSAAEVRTDGRAFEGKLVRWTLQLVAVQTADELRRDMPSGQRYLLTRGPIPEAGFVYVLISPAQATALEGVTPLSYLTVVGRVRTARSRYLGNPILELVDHEIARQ
jgi:hypothetical protein